MEPQEFKQLTKNSLLYQALNKFFISTGIPLLCNTSLNDKGEPIIDTIDQAFNFALRKGIPIVYIDGNRYKLKNFHLYKTKYPLKRNDNLFFELLAI